MGAAASAAVSLILFCWLGSYASSKTQMFSRSDATLQYTSGLASIFDSRTKSLFSLSLDRVECKNSFASKSRPNSYDYRNFRSFLPSLCYCAIGGLFVGVRIDLSERKYTNLIQWSRIKFHTNWDDIAFIRYK